MKKILSVAAVSAVVLTAGYGFAGNAPPAPNQGCPGDCQDQINDLQSSQDRQDEQINANAANIIQNQAEIDALKQGVYNPWYVKGIAKLAMMHDVEVNYDSGDYQAETEAGYGFGMALGREFGDFRAEAEISTQKCDLEAFGSGDGRINTVTVNGVYDYPVYGPVSVYGTMGMGAGKVDATVEQQEDSEVTFAYKAGAGIAYDIMSNMAVDFGFEYLGTGDVDIENIKLEDIRSSNIVAGFRYNF